MALIGRAQEAVTAGEKSVEIMPITKDAIEGAYALIELARIHAQVGNPNEALDLIEHLLSFPSGLSVGLLELDPAWDALRHDPRFQALLEKYDSPSN